MGSSEILPFVEFAADFTGALSDFAGALEFFTGSADSLGALSGGE